VRRILIAFFILGAAGLWAWFALDFANKRRTHGHPGAFFSADHRAALVIWNPEALLSALKDMEPGIFGEDTLLRAHMIGWIELAESMMEPEAMMKSEVPPAVLYFNEIGPVLFAVDGFVLNENAGSLADVGADFQMVSSNGTLIGRWVEGSLLLAADESHLPSGSSGAMALPVSEAKVASWVLRLNPAAGGEIKWPSDFMLSAEWEPSEDRHLLYGFATHTEWTGPDLLSARHEPKDPQFLRKGDVLFFGDYDAFHSRLRETGSNEWRAEITALEDECNCSIRDRFSGWNSGVGVFWKKGEDAVMAFELTNPEEFWRLEELVKGMKDCDGAVHSVSSPRMPNAAFGYRGAFPVCRCQNGVVTFGTSERALGLFRSAPVRQPVRGELSRFSALIHLDGDDFASKILGESRLLLRPESPSRTYVQLASAGPGSAVSASDDLLWRVELAAEVKSGFFPVTNHNTLETEIFFQDETGAVNLLSASGKILWSRKVNGTIRGAVNQVDLFKNGKLQMLFSTEKELWCLDRNGNPTEGFPVKFSTAASGPVSVIDYERNRDYRLIVPLADGSMTNLDGKGKPVKGWQFKNTSSPVLAVDHFRFGSNDHIVTIHADGTIQSLQRTGILRQVLPGVAAGIADHFFIRKGKNLEDSYVMYQSEPGKLRMAEFGKKGFEEQETPGVDWSLWWYGSVNSDSRPDLLLIGADMATLYLQGAETEVLMPLDELPSGPPFILSRPEGEKWLFFDRPESESIVAFDLAGLRVAAFPVAGRGPMFASERGGVVRLVCISGSEIICRELVSQP
jgi:hypothetical protein